MNENEKPTEPMLWVQEKRELLREIEYLRDSVKTQTEIINQLTGKPGEYEYIHPFDVADMIEDLTVDEILLIDGSVFSEHNYLIIDGQKYKQSPFIPARTTKYV